MFSKPGYAALAIMTETFLKERKMLKNIPRIDHKTVRLPTVNHMIVLPVLMDWHSGELVGLQFCDWVVVGFIPDRDLKNGTSCSTSAWHSAL